VTSKVDPQIRELTEIPTTDLTWHNAPPQR